MPLDDSLLMFERNNVQFGLWSVFKFVWGWFLVQTCRM